MEFEWDLTKEEKNIRKHGISFVVAAETFADPVGRQLIDACHSARESRYYWVGKAADGRILTTRFTKRGPIIRIFGCANWRKFRRLYYEATKTR